MPTVVSSSTPTPPAAAFQPVMRILKRPTNSTNSSVSSVPSTESFSEREARYQAARERIFGNGEPLSSSSSSAVVRNPRGPEEEKGFTQRNGNTSQSQAPTLTRTDDG
ncbi:uncharacterized protein BT62DRAFT_935601 [Guyanagaster necrorhizus]|uniref:SUZ RNA-binding domain-containing n=1 Tax=Guyanagaster necrorhizus TaxID=856835 RepID=A0A9P7VKN0_9AGAR|nr:uncharacterized protein BT62DRAFT_935601 [Guyanagaster necrorhizus MCA 3950]KAG7442873.1 hypothetical protein BT62DRAFT_935601 [Guyanagaster necrorhizus MCA 3950]